MTRGQQTPHDRQSAEMRGATDQSPLADVSLAEPRFTRSDEAVVVELWPGVLRKTLGWGDRMLVAEITLRAGSVVPEHSHPHEQVGYVARGRLEFVVGGNRAILQPGDGYVIPGDVPHSVIAHEDAIAIDIFSPVRTEYQT